MQPISYSLIFNFLCVAVMAALSWKFERPELVLLTILVLPHALERFRPDGADDDEQAQAIAEARAERHATPSMGFLSDPESRI